MKTRVLSIFLILLLCLTAGCGKASQNTEKPDGFSFSESQTEEAAGKDTSQAEQTAPAQPPEAQSAQTADRLLGQLCQELCRKRGADAGQRSRLLLGQA